MRRPPAAGADLPPDARDQAHDPPSARTSSPSTSTRRCWTSRRCARRWSRPAQPETLLPTVFARTLLTGFAARAVGSWCRVPRRVRRGAGPGERPGAGRAAPRCRGASASWRRTRTSSRRCAGWPRPASGWSRSPTAPPASPRPGWSAAGSPRWSSASLSSEVDPRLEARRARPTCGRPAVCDVAPDRMALVAAHGWDVLGAQRAGLTGAWFPRSERSYPAVYDAAARARRPTWPASSTRCSRCPRHDRRGRHPARPGPGARHGRRRRAARWCSGTAPAAASSRPTWSRSTAEAAGGRLAGGAGRAAVAGGRQADRARSAAARRGLDGGARPRCAPTACSPARWCSAAAAPAPGSPAGRRPRRAPPACWRWPSRCTRRAGRRRAGRPS